jgi:hypothetical protein
VEARLHEEAARRGQDAAEYVKALVEDRLRPTSRPFHETATKAEWRRAFLAWVNSHGDITAPPIPLEILRRENLYEDRVE